MRPAPTRSVATFVVLLGLALAVPSPAASPPPDDTAVRAAFAAFMDALNAPDAERMTAAFTPDATAFFPNVQADRADGREALGAIFRSFAERMRKTTARLDLIPEDVTVEVAAPLAVVTANVRSSAPGTVRRRTFVFRLVGERWLICHLHASDAIRPIP